MEYTMIYTFSGQHINYICIMKTMRVICNNVNRYEAEHGSKQQSLVVAKVEEIPTPRLQVKLNLNQLISGKLSR